MGPVPGLLEIEDHVPGELGGAVVIEREFGRVLGRETSAVLLHLIADHGLRRELKASDISASSAVEWPVRRTHAARLAMCELSDHFRLARLRSVAQCLGLQRGGRRWLRPELTSGDEKGDGHEPEGDRLARDRRSAIATGGPTSGGMATRRCAAGKPVDEAWPGELRHWWP